MKSLLFALLSAVSVHASTFTASYLFEDGLAISAEFQGTRNGNVVSDISNLWINVTGSWWPDVGHVHLTQVNPASYMTFDGSPMFFAFGTDIDVEPGEDWWEYNVAWGMFLDLPNDEPNLFLYYFVAGDNYYFDPANWSLTESASPKIPDTGATSLLLVSALLVLGALRRLRTN